MLDRFLAQWQVPVAPEQASEFARDYDILFFALTALTVFFTVIVFAMIIVFAVRYRKGNKVDRSRPMTSNLMLEATWTVIPLILGLIMFFWAAKLFIDSRVPPKDAMDIYIIGKQWMWHAQHPNGVRENNTLHVPVGKPVRLIMISQDVIHSFFLPAFRIKQDVLPGRYTMQWFTATKPGKYPIFCAEYCGTQHSEMGGYLYVMPADEYQAWVAAGGEKADRAAVTFEQLGKKVWDANACGNCHGMQDNERAPSLNGLVGRKRDFTDGTSLKADQAYFRSSLYDPYSKIVKGYERIMPQYKGQLSEEQVLQLYFYVRSLGMQPETPAPTIPGATAAGVSARTSGNPL